MPNGDVDMNTTFIKVNIKAYDYEWNGKWYVDKIL